MSDTPCFTTGSEKLPTSIYIPTTLTICRGTPSEMVLEMASSDRSLTLREALEGLVRHLAESDIVHIELPWHLPDEALCNLFIQALLATGLAKPSPLS